MNVTATLFGLQVSVTTMAEILARIDQWIAARDRQYICTADVHALMECQSDPEVMRAYNGAGMVTPDGMPLVWLLRDKGYAFAQRVCGPDLLPTLFGQSEARGYRHFLYGSSETTLVRLQATLQRQYPRAVIAGAYSPPFRELLPEEDDAIVRSMNDARPDIVWVGLGAPKQDRWMANHRDRLSAPVLIGVGAAFDMVAGMVPRAPPVMQRLGCEWTYRLWQEPRRLWKRYLMANSRFAMIVLREQLNFSSTRVRG